VDVLVAGSADHEVLASSLGHEVYPGWFVGIVRAVEVGEFCDVVNFDVRSELTDLTASRDEPVDQLIAFGAAMIVTGRTGSLCVGV
jgi:hypothetical protein